MKLDSLRCACFATTSIFCFVLSGCLGDDVRLLGGDLGNSSLVCVESDAGHCCQELYDGPTVGCVDSVGKCGPHLVDDAGIDCGGRASCAQQFERTPLRCIYCQPQDIDDGGANATMSPPRDPAPGSGQTPPGGSDDEDGGALFVQVCGPAAYMKSAEK